MLVQTNFGGDLTINGAPVGRELGRYPFQAQLRPGGRSGGDDLLRDDGSCMIVVATDAPLSAHSLERIGRRVRTSPGPIHMDDLLNASSSALFEATVEATQEAVYNALNWDRTLPPGKP